MPTKASAKGGAEPTPQQRNHTGEVGCRGKGTTTGPTPPGGMIRWGGGEGGVWQPCIIYRVQGLCHLSVSVFGYIVLPAAVPTGKLILSQHPETNHER